MITVLLLSPALDVTYLVPSLTPGEIHRPRRVIRLAGGKGINLARAGGRLGAQVRVVAPLGGFAGEFVAQLAAEAGIELTSVHAKATTRTCVTVAADDDRALTELYEAPAELSPAELDSVAAALRGLTRTTGWTVLSGSVPAGVDPAIVVSMLQERAEAGDRIAVDSHGAMLEAVVEGIRPDLIKVNRHEAAGLVAADPGHPLEAVQLARRVRERSGGVVIVTDAANGAVAVTDQGEWRVVSDAEPGAFPVGSGDTFLAGYLAALETGAPIQEALVVAATAAAANAAVPGGAVFDPAYAHELRSTTTVRTL